jgi:hypothetical protein
MSSHNTTPAETAVAAGCYTLSDRHEQPPSTIWALTTCRLLEPGHTAPGEATAGSIEAFIQVQHLTD